MYRVIFAAVVVALLLELPSPTEGSRKEPFKMMQRSCFPDNVTKATCFAELPNAAHLSMSFLSFLLPSADDDSYVIEGTKDFDAVDFTVSRVEQNPKYICQHNTTIIQALTCMGQSMQRKCPFLPDVILHKHENIAKSFKFICSKVDELDPLCMLEHKRFMRPCSQQVSARLLRSFFRKSSRPQSSHESGETTTTTEAPGNQTMTEPKRERMALASCYFLYQMSACVKESLKTCHGPTAQIMFDFMRTWETANCSANMEAWDKAGQSKLVADCHGNQCGTAAHSAPAVVVMHLLLLLVAVKMVTWKH